MADCERRLHERGREAPHHRLRRGRISRVSRAHRERCAQRVRNDPLFCVSSGAFAALRAAGAGAAPSCWRSFETGKRGHQVDEHRRRRCLRQQLAVQHACASGACVVAAPGGGCGAVRVYCSVRRPGCAFAVPAARMSLLHRCFAQPSRTKSERAWFACVHMRASASGHVCPCQLSRCSALSRTVVW